MIGPFREFCSAYVIYAEPERLVPGRAEMRHAVRCERQEMKVHHEGAKLDPRMDVLPPAVH